MKTTKLSILFIAIPSAMLCASATYDKSCKSCHGVAGVANPAIAKMMKVEMKDLGSGEVQSLTDDQLKKMITEGKGKMKPVHTVSGAALDEVIAHVRTFKK